MSKGRSAEAGLSRLLCAQESDANFLIAFSLVCINRFRCVEWDRCGRMSGCMAVLLGMAKTATLPLSGPLSLCKVSWSLQDSCTSISHVERPRIVVEDV